MAIFKGCHLRGQKPKECHRYPKIAIMYLFAREGSVKEWNHDN